MLEQLPVVFKVPPWAWFKRHKYNPHAIPWYLGHCEEKVKFSFLLIQNYFLLYSLATKFFKENFYMKFDSEVTLDVTFMPNFHLVDQLIP